jgi:hypothetical protein
MQNKYIGVRRLEFEDDTNGKRLNPLSNKLVMFNLYDFTCGN